MKLIVSHFAVNQGVTDYFINFLVSRGETFYVLKHPFADSKMVNSELLYFFGKEQKVIRTYRRFDSEKLNIAWNFIVTVYVALFLRKKVKTMIAFGSFNASGLAISNVFSKNKTIFWGVDYSRKRFLNIILNNIYKLTETLACKFCTFTISQSLQQQRIRMSKHGLIEKRSILSSNGVEEVFNAPTWKYKSNSDLLYIGSITKQHGIIDFIKYCYIDNNLDRDLFIIGAGPESDVLKELIASIEDIKQRIHYLGYHNPHQIRNWLESQKENLYGIAPYSDTGKDHVMYGDSLKIKEYLAHGIPYITSSIVPVPDDLKQFGIIYRDNSEFISKIDVWQQEFCFEIQKRNEIMNNYLWNNLFSKIISIIDLKT